jgi:hypothetical protein
MAAINETTAGLRFFGDDLNPAEISTLLNGDPSKSAKIGDLRDTPRGAVVERTGKWIRNAPRETPGNLQKQIAGLLFDLTDDLSVWRSLSARFRADIFVGIFMREGNEGLALQPDTLKLLSDRRLELNLDIYGPFEQQ